MAPSVEPTPTADNFTDGTNSLQRRETDLQSREAAMRTQNARDDVFDDEEK